jgi:hypothetical protein
MRRLNISMLVSLPKPKTDDEGCGKDCGILGCGKSDSFEIALKSIFHAFLFLFFYDHSGILIHVKHMFSIKKDHCIECSIVFILIHIFG